MTEVHLLLGGNLGERKTILTKAKALLSSALGKFVSASSFYETAAWGKKDQNDFLNQVIIIKTKLPSEEVLTQIQKIETDLGRIRFEKWGERTIDIDILFMETLIVDTPNLKIPHPFIQDRKFTLVPLLELSANFIHPVLNKTIQELLIACPDQLPVTKMD